MHVFRFHHRILGHFGEPMRACTRDFRTQSQGQAPIVTGHINQHDISTNVCESHLRIYVIMHQNWTLQFLPS